MSDVRAASSQAGRKTAPVAAGLSMATFAHADRHGSRHATAWGVGAFLLAGVVVPVYFVNYWLGKRHHGTPL
jgi:hypothetical protein